MELLEASEGGSEQRVRELLDKKADVNASDKQGFTALMRASISGNGNYSTRSKQRYARIAKLLIQQGAAVNKRNSHGDTSLHISCAFGRTMIAEVLIENGADINGVNNDFMTPLMIATVKGHRQTVEKLWITERM